MVAFPAFKLGALLLKQISKPLATAVKNRAKSNPFFRTYICMPPAQFYHWCDVKLKMWTMNLGKPITVTKLNENMAIELGAELLGEGIIFAIASAVLTFEYIRSTRREAQKEEERKEELSRIQIELKELYFARARQETQIRELIRALRLNIPSLNYSESMTFDAETIPEHHRNEAKVTEGTSIYTRMNNLIWAAVDFVVPPVEDTGRLQREDGPVFIIKVAEENTSSTTNSTSPLTSVPSPAPAELAPVNVDSSKCGNKQRV